MVRDSFDAAVTASSSGNARGGGEDQSSGDRCGVGNGGRAHGYPADDIQLPCIECLYGEAESERYTQDIELCFVAAVSSLWVNLGSLCVFMRISKRVCLGFGVKFFHGKINQLFLLKKEVPCD